MTPGGPPKGMTPSGGLTPGDVARIGSYRLDAVMGRGATSVVYRATHEKLEREVALKLFTTPFAGGARPDTRLVREARVLARLNLPGVLPIYDADVVGDLPYIVTPLMSEPTLAVLVRGRRMTEAEALRVARSMLRTLAAVHQAGIVHRDLKPSNLFVAPDHTVTLADFGLACSLADAPITRPGVSVGTPLYMAPEQMEGGRGDIRSDVYAAGLIVYEMMCGRLPFSQHLTDVVHEKLVRPVVSSPREIGVPVSAALEGLLLGACVRDPQERFPSCDAFLEALDAAARARAGRLRVVIRSRRVVSLAAPEAVAPLIRRVRPLAAILAASLMAVLATASARPNQPLRRPPSAASSAAAPARREWPRGAQVAAGLAGVQQRMADLWPGYAASPLERELAALEATAVTASGDPAEALYRSLLERLGSRIPYATLKRIVLEGRVPVAVAEWLRPGIDWRAACAPERGTGSVSDAAGERASWLLHRMSAATCARIVVGAIESSVALISAARGRPARVRGVVAGDLVLLASYLSALQPAGGARVDPQAVLELMRGRPGESAWLAGADPQSMACLARETDRCVRASLGSEPAGSQQHTE